MNGISSEQNEKQSGLTADSGLPKLEAYAFSEAEGTVHRHP